MSKERPPGRPPGQHWKGYGHIPGTLMAITQRNARDRKIEITVTLEELNTLYLRQKGRCALSGAELTFQIRSNTVWQHGSTSVDRIDSSKGYTIDNIQLVDKRVNISKHMMSNNDFLAMCAQITEYSNGKTNVEEQEPPKELNLRPAWAKKISNSRQVACCERKKSRNTTVQERQSKRLTIQNDQRQSKLSP